MVMTDNRWVGLTLKTVEEAEEWFGELDCSLEDFFAAPENSFIRLNHSRWLEATTEFEEPTLVRNQDGDSPFTHYLYFRKSDVSLIRPLTKPLSTSDDPYTPSS
ncbi:hypothetical protein CVU37_11175 [candidate division BRC1 bacterium HGW-BRC1-1]|jgi:hypothetical protein|nr:MAG: hypothetical protein CVU37_11175 [candidate division BRC1 bacterium HGW-BRC1-1]